MLQVIAPRSLAAVRSSNLEAVESNSGQSAKVSCSAVEYCCCAKNTWGESENVWNYFVETLVGSADLNRR